jgi:SAM-dependent methyltransferase
MILRGRMSHNKKSNYKTKHKPIYDTERIGNAYHEEFKKYGYSLASIMIPKGASDARFKAKFDIGDLAGCKILDVGCGFGHMLDYLHAWGITAQYTGVDICPPFIEIAKKRHPEADFRLLDILNSNIKEKWDWVFLVGAFNVAPKKQRWWPYVQAMITRMYDLCRQGIAVDFLSSYVDFRKEKAFHAQPEKVFSFAKTITRRVALRHDYMAYEFTLYLYKKQTLTENHIFADFKEAVLPCPKI